MTDLPARSKRRKLAPVPADFGTVLTRLSEPEVAAQLTVVQANEIRARDEELTFVAAQAQHFQRLLTLLAQEKALFIRGICNANGLSAEDAFNADLERGVLLRVATRVPIMPEETVEKTPEAEPANGETETGGQ